MKNLPDPSFFLQVNESFIKAARLESSGDRPCLTALREISSAELVSQPNPIVQIAGEDPDIPIPVASTLSLGETIYHSHAFEQIGFSTLTEFIGQQGNGDLHKYELGVFQRSNGMPAPTASPTPLELVFCGFNSEAIPDLSDAFPNLDAEPTSITLATLDLFRFLKSQCQGEEQVLLLEIGSENSHLFLINANGLDDLQSINLGRNALYEAIAEVLHLHYIGSAVKLFTRSGFDSSELAPKLGALFGNAIQSVLESRGWKPDKVLVSGLLHAQSWFQEAILKVLGLESFQIDRSRLPFDIDGSLKNLSALDSEILSKVYTSLVSDEDFSWHNDYLSSLSKSASIPRRESNGSNPPFPTAHPDRLAPVTPVQMPVEPEPEPVPTSPYAPSPQPEPEEAYAPVEEPTPVQSSPPPQSNQEVEAIPEHLLRDFEDYEGEFEDIDDYGGGRVQFWIKTSLFCFSVLLVAAMVMIVFFPAATEEYFGFRPPHLQSNDPDPDPYTGESDIGGSSAFATPVEVTETAVASGIQELREEREQVVFGGLYLPTTPNGATVVVGDMEPSLSPVKLPNIEPGTYDVVISKDGYQTQALTVTIEPKEVKRVETVVLQKLP